MNSERMALRLEIEEVRNYLNREGYLKEESYNIVQLNQTPPEFFPKGLVAFGEDGGGDFICFDYREGKDNPNPPIVYWRHDANEGEDVSFIAKDFETFIGMLKSEDELDK